MADAPDPITSSPSMGHYDATSDADFGGWVKVSADPPGGSEDQWSTDFPDSAPWMQC